MRKIRTILGVGTKVNIVEVETTPEMAQEILDTHRLHKNKGENSQDNRKPKSANDYSFLMRNGLWESDACDSLVMFDENENLINGQNRMLALSKSNKSVIMAYKLNAKKSIFMDTGRSRTTVESLVIIDSANGGVEDKELLNTNIRHIVNGMLSLKHVSGKKVYQNELFAMYNHYKKELLEFLPVAGYKLRAPVYVAAFAAYINGVDIDTLSKFLFMMNDRLFVRGEEQCDPVKKCWEFVYNFKGGGQAIYSQVYQKCQYAIWAYANSKNNSNSYMKVCYDFSLDFLNIDPLEPRYY